MSTKSLLDFRISSLWQEEYFLFSQDTIPVDLFPPRYTCPGWRRAVIFGKSLSIISGGALDDVSKSPDKSTCSHVIHTFVLDLCRLFWNGGTGTSWRGSVKKADICRQPFRLTLFLIFFLTSSLLGRVLCGRIRRFWLFICRTKNINDGIPEKTSLHACVWLWQQMCQEPCGWHVGRSCRGLHRKHYSHCQPGAYIWRGFAFSSVQLVSIFAR